MAKGHRMTLAYFHVVFVKYTDASGVLGAFQDARCCGPAMALPDNTFCVDHVILQFKGINFIGPKLCKLSKATILFSKIAIIASLSGLRTAH